MLVILDIDGTLASCAHRVHLLGEVTFNETLNQNVYEHGKNWDAFLNPEEVAKDTVIPGAQEGFAYFKQINANILFLTGRNENLRPVTEEWLFKHFGVKTNPKNLLMREGGDLRIPTEVKREHLSRLVYTYGNQDWIAVDDDKYMQPVYIEFNALTLLAPECWKSMFQVHTRST